MRILVITTDCFGGHGGIAQYTRDLCAALASHPRCTEVRILARNQPMPTGPLPHGVLQDAKATRGRRAFVWACMQAAADRGYDLVVCAHVNLLPLAALVTAIRRVPVVLVVYGIDVWKPVPRRLARWLATRARHLVSISAITRDRMRSWARLPRATVHILPNGIDLGKYRSGEKPMGLLDRYGLHGKRVLLTLARLSAAERYKGVDEILEELPALRREDPTLHYVVVGDGSDKERLMSKAAALGAAEYVVFSGRIPEEEKPAHYRLADAFAMPGRGEGFGFVFLEAMACGIPVVASRLDGSREAVRDGMLGRLVDPDDRAELRAGLLAALRSPRGTVPEGLGYFDMANFESRTHAIVDAVLKGNA
jgi:glycosyltransferase involved in cell wall biosynthesis